MNLTAKGKKLAIKFKTAFKKKILLIMEKLSHEERENYLRIIKKIYGAVA